MKSSYYLSGIFHMLIIAMFLLGVSGCGYKADPFYMQEDSSSALEDENVRFIEKETSVKQ